MTSPEDGYFGRLRNFWFPNLNNLYWLLLALPALYFFQTLIHEGSHAFAALFATGDLPKLAPYPHVSAAGFRNGVAFTGGRGFVAMPQFVDLVLVIGLSVLLTLWCVKSAGARLLLRLWYFGVCVDLLYNTARELVGGHNVFADWSKFQDSAGLSSGVMVLITVLFWLVVLSHFGWVHLSSCYRHQPDATGFFDYPWPALVMGLLSVAALLFSAFVSDPSIDKGHVAFILPVIVQVGAFIWYWAYFIICMVKRARA